MYICTKRHSIKCNYSERYGKESNEGPKGLEIQAKS